jgi:hypothetical protein
VLPDRGLVVAITSQPHGSDILTLRIAEAFASIK